MFSIGNSVLATATIKLLSNLKHPFMWNLMRVISATFCGLIKSQGQPRCKGVEKPVSPSAGGTAKSHLNRVCAEETWPLTYLASYCVGLLLYIPACTQPFSSDVLFHLIHAQTVRSCTIWLG